MFAGSLPRNSRPLIPPEVHTVPLKCYDRDIKITNSPYSFCDKMASSLCGESAEEVRSGDGTHCTDVRTPPLYTHALSITL